MKLEDHLDKLRAFKVISETGKLRTAAAKLHLAQPSLTRLIQTLEEAAGAKLLYRSRQGVALTSAGNLLLSYASNVLHDLEDLEARLGNPSDQLAGHLKVGSYETLAEYLWPDFIASFKKTTPHLRLSIQTGGTQNLSKLEQGTLDILVDAEPRIVGDFTSWMLFEDRFQFFAKGKENLPLDPDSIEEYPLIYVPGAFDQDNKSILQHLEEKGYTFKEKIELDSFTSVRTFCSKGLGIGVLPIRLAETILSHRQMAAVSLRGFPEKGFGRHSICATILSSRAEDPRLRYLVKQLREWFKA